MFTKLFPGKVIKALLGAAALSAGILIAGAAPIVAQDDDPQSPDPFPTPTPVGYPAGTVMVELSFDTIRFSKGDDGCDWWGGWFTCTPDTDLEVYGTMGGQSSSGRGGQRNLGKWGSAGSCTLESLPWSSDGDGSCLRKVWPGNGFAYDPGFTHFFADAKLCAGSSNGSCYGSYQKNNNKIRFHVSPGEKIHASINMMDYDWGSANDSVCKAQGTVGPFTAAQLKYLNASSTMFQGWNGHGECFVGWHVKRVY